MSSAEAKFFQEGNKHRTALADDVEAGRKEFKEQLMMTPYRQGRDPQYLGIMGRNYYAKPWGNDSSNVQAVLNGPAYWKRVYYRENIAAKFEKDDEASAAAERGAASSDGVRRSASEPSLQRLPAEEPEDGYAGIKSSMKPFVERQGKPRIKPLATGERLNFFNSMEHKYHMKAGGKNLSWNVSKVTHTSTKNELKWMCSNYMRTDSQAVLAGQGSMPPV